VHGEAPVGATRPVLLIPIPIELDAVAVWVAQVQRFADAVVARAVEPDAGVDEAAQSVGEQRTRRIEDGDMEQPRRTGWWRRAAFALPSVEADVVVIAAGREECRVAPVALLQLEAEHAAIERQCAVEIGHFQVRVADAHARIDGARREIGLESGRRGLGHTCSPQGVCPGNM
jgi:hypothetical protein